VTSNRLHNKTIALKGEPSPDWLEKFLGLCQQEVNIAKPNSRAPESVQQAWFDEIGADEICYAGVRANADFLGDGFVANILLKTSGSSSRPKTVVHSCENFILSAKALCEEIGLNSNHIWNLSLPIYHVGGLAIIFRCLVSGARIYFKKNNLENITHLSLVNAQLKKISKNSNNLKKLKRLDLILLGGGIIDEELKSLCEKNNIKIALSYGSTETCSAIALDWGGGLKIFGANKIKISENNSEILIKSPNLFLGYLEDKKIEFCEKNYFKTGDLGFLDQNNNLIITGRKSNLIISGGENIQGEEIEQVLRSFDFIEEVVVFGVLDKKFGERPHAVIKTQIDISSVIPDLIRNLKTKLAKYKIPDKFYAWPQEFEISKSLKISRNKIKSLVLHQKGSQL